MRVGKVVFLRVEKNILWAKGKVFQKDNIRGQNKSYQGELNNHSNFFRSQNKLLSN